MYARAFSLIELMVVVAIVGILSVSVMPAYKSYVLRAQILNSHIIMERVMQDIHEYYELNGTFPSSIEFNSVTIPSAQWQQVDFDEIFSMSYISNVSNGGDQGYARLGVSLTGLEGIPNYVSPLGANPTGAVYNSYFFQMTKIAGENVIEFQCGHLNAATETTWIPLDYLPHGCKCTNVADYLTNGTCTP